jgi:pimeloyl-ACP methyl ester carboxylesterase
MSSLRLRTHEEDNDISGVGVLIGRPKQVSRVIDTLLGDAELGSHIQQERIGVVGHSNGGYTALAVVGAKPSPAASVAHCRQHPDDSKFCSSGGAATREATRKVGDIPDVRDPRVRAIVLMAPNTAPFTDDALARVAVPVRVYGAERDDLTLVRYHAERLAKALPSQTEYVLVQRAGHFSFVASFPGILTLVAGEAAQDPEGFDRHAMHEAMNSEIVGFFDRNPLRDRKACNDVCQLPKLGVDLESSCQDPPPCRLTPSFAGGRRPSGASWMLDGSSPDWVVLGARWSHSRKIVRPKQLPVRQRIGSYAPRSGPGPRQTTIGAGWELRRGGRSP